MKNTSLCLKKIRNECKKEMKGLSKGSLFILSELKSFFNAQHRNIQKY
jgi:hypothetical protein